jgi:hypothetical protein
MGRTPKVIVAVSACVICFGIGVFVGYSEAGGDLRAEFFGHDHAPCPRPGDILTDKVLTEGCVDGGSNSVQFLPTWTCTDGRKLLSDDRMFGFSGKRIIASDDTSADPAYAKAYRECVPQR